MEAKWFDNPDCTIETEAGRRAYFKTFYADASGRECLCHLETIGLALPEETALECKAKMAVIGMVNTIKNLAGVNNRLKVIEAEGRVAARPVEETEKKEPKNKDHYSEI